MTSKNIIKILTTDKKLSTILSGIIFSGLALVTLVITAGAMYL